MTSPKRISQLLITLSAWFFVAALFSLFIIRMIWLMEQPRILDLSSDIRNLQDIDLLRDLSLVLADMATHQRERAWKFAVWGFGFVAIWCVLFGATAVVLYRRLRSPGAVADSLPQDTGLLDSALGGTLPLWKAFWGLYILLPYALGLVLGGPILLLKHFNLIQGASAADLILTPLMYSAVFVVHLGGAIIAWRSSKNTSRPAWHYLARTTIILHTVIPLIIGSIVMLGIHTGFRIF